MNTLMTGVACSSCGRPLAHDHVDTICSPCRRTGIEQSAHQQYVIARDRPGIKAAFDEGGLYAVARHLGCAPDAALDVLFSAQLVLFVSERRREVLRQMVLLGDRSHVAVADALNISRWTVATYRQQLGIDRTPSVGRSRKQRGPS